jgi:hypothetical protein
MTLTLRKIRDLEVAPPTSRGAFLSAASGIVAIGDRAYVVADDEHHLGVFSLSRDSRAEPGILLRSVPGDLPLATKARKKIKPDHEAILIVPPALQPPFGGLALIPSGSKKHRSKMTVFAFDARGSLDAEPTTVDLAELYEEFSQLVPRLNIEGAALEGSVLKLANRGNKADDANVIFAFDARRIWPSAAKTQQSGAVSLTHYHLGEIEGVPLTFTDISALEDGSLLFTAAAEDTDDPYDDAPNRGSAVGLIDAAGKLQWIKRVAGTEKLEGISSWQRKTLVVNDPDNPELVAGIYAIDL